MGWFMNRKDRGAQLVEFALIAPLLIILLLGIIEFGYIFGQYNDIRHGAHEGARLAAVDDASLGTNTCNAMNLAGTVTVDFDLTGTDPGSQASVEVDLTVDSLSGLGLIEVFLPSNLETRADFKLEQPATNWNSTNQDSTC